jgi:uncharacterized membrane protein/transglutaminase-like putative cysteine protease
MSPRRLTSWLAPTTKIRRPRKTIRPRLGVELLEERLAPAAGLSPDIVVGRTLSAYTTSAVQNHTLEVTYTIYNEQADDVTGVLLATTIQPGVSFASASALPDRNGQDLAWSLGTLHGFDRLSVTLTVTLPASIPLQIDGGAHAFGTLNAGMVSAGTPAATLVNRTIPADRLASTPDANTTDPFVQEEAAKLRYDPQAIFGFLNSDIGYESYIGSLRGARGTLWSAAGNSLDEASLGVALFRASGIPAQYAHGTLSDPLAQQMILSMFPPSFQTVGYIPAGTPVADPANDAQLLAETRDHYWVQFDSTGGGFIDADTSGLPGGGIGTAFTTADSTFTEVADSLRQKTEVKLDAEIYTQAAALFGVGNGLGTTTVLDQTFNDVDLVGRPLTIGNFVTQSGAGFIISSVTNTYTPFIETGDYAFPDPSQNRVTLGTQYQEVQTNFPLGTQLLTGLFVTVVLSGPQFTTVTEARTLYDRIGYAARQGLAAIQLTPNPGSLPALNEDQLWTLSLQAALVPDAAVLALTREDEALGQAASAGSPDELTLYHHEFIGLSQLLGADFQNTSDSLNSQLALTSQVAAYFANPRVTISSVLLTPSADGTSASLQTALDLRRDTIRVLAPPGQSPAAVQGFNGARGLVENEAEAHSLPPASPGGAVHPAVNTLSILQAAADQGIAMVTINPTDLGQLDALDISAEARARITAALSEGKTVVVPSREVNIDGSAQIGWYESDPQTGEIVGVLEDGTHGVFDKLALFALGALLTIGFVKGFLDEVSPSDLENDLTTLFARIRKCRDSDNSIDKVGAKACASQLFTDLAETKADSFFRGVAKFILLTAVMIDIAGEIDPPVTSVQQSVKSAFGQNNQLGNVQIVTSLAGGGVSGISQAGSATASGILMAAWSSTASTGFSVTSLTVASATITNANGTTIGSGAVALAAAAPVAAAVAGNNTYTVNGTGTLAFYGPAESSLGVSGNWDNYTANVNGTVSITLTTDGLMLNGTKLPAGTYTITTSAATIGGSGPSSSPNFSGSATVTAANGTVNLGAGTGTVTVGGSPLDISNGATLTGYTGSLTVTAAGGGMDSIALSGAAANVLTIAASPAAVPADQNTPASFQVNVDTSFADTYTLAVQAPTGWTAAIDATGHVTVTPAPGLQTGTYPVRVVARSSTNPDLVEQTIVNVTVTATLPGITFAVDHDDIFTVPYNGAQVPSAFRATIHNLGPAADSYDLTFANLPAGFDVLNSGTSLTIPAGETGISGLYLQPNGGPLPAPGTVITFDVTATSTTDPSITQTVTVTFVMPEVHGITLTSTPNAVSTTPGGSTTATLSLTAVGNVADANTLTFTSPAGLAVSGLPQSVTLNPGQTVTFVAGLTPGASTPLNSTLAATFTATFGPAGSPLTQTIQVPVRVVVPGADAIAGASTAASQLGNADLANRLDDLATALTNLFQNPGNAVFLSQALAAIGAMSGLLGADVFLAPLIPNLTADHDQLANASTSTEIGSAITALGNDLGALNAILADEAAHRFSLVLNPNSAVALPNAPATFDLDIANNGTQASTYDFSVSGLPGNVASSFNVASITLNPGERTTGANRVFLSLTETGNSLFATGFTVTAVAEGAPEITQSVTGALTVRPAFVNVISVTTTPPFTDPGGQVQVSARLLNAVNQERMALMSYSVKDSGGNVVFNSTTVPVTLTLQSSLATVDLGTLDTTGFSPGSYAIEVLVTDTSGVPIPGATGAGSLLVGSPVTASLSVSPTLLPPGNGTVTNTLSLTAQTSFAPPYTLVGQVATTPTSSTIVIEGTIAYVAGSNGVDIVDVSDPTAPKVLSTFAQSLIVQGGYTVVRELPGDRILVASTTTFNANGTRALVYDVSDPLNPALITNTVIPEAFMSDFLASGPVGLLTTSGVFLSGSGSNGSAFAQFGDVTALDLNAAGGPAITDRLVGTGNPPFTGDHQESGGTIVDSTTAYITGTDLAGGNFTSGVGQLLVVNYADPNNLVLTRALPVPGTVRLYEVAVDGNLALAVGTNRGDQNPWNNNDANPSNDSGSLGNLTLTTLDITDPTNPVVLSTVVTAAVFPRGNQPSSKLAVVPVGGGKFAVSNGIVDGHPVMFLVDASDPQNLTASAFQVHAVVSEMTVRNGELYTTSADGLLIYDVGQVDMAPVTASVHVPNGTGVSVVANSFNIPPTQVIPGTDYDTLVFNRSLAFGLSAETITWQTSLTGLQPGEARAVTLGGTVDFTAGGTAASFALPPTSVATAQVLRLTPASQTTAPGAVAPYTLTLQNPTATSVTYTLSVQGVPASWVALASNVTVPAGGSIDTPLTLTSDSFTPDGDNAFTVVAEASTGFTGAVMGTLTLAGTLAAIDPQSHGVVAALNPVSATAGQGTSARFTVRLTNTGSTTESFTLSISGLPGNVAADFSQTSISVPPGAGNFREVTLILTPALGATVGNDLFAVSAASSSSSAAGSATGTLVVASAGVSVNLNKSTGTPGDTFLATVKNTGTAADTFDLSVAGPAGLVAALGTPSVTLAPGQSQTVAVTTQSANFAAQGALGLTVVAQSHANSAVKDAASAGLAIAATTGLTAAFEPASITVAAATPANFNVKVDNTGNTEDSYTATITGTTGPITASLIGLDGLPTQTIPIFRLPGLSSGILPLKAELSAPGQGTVTVTITSTTDPSRTAAVTATVIGPGVRTGHDQIFAVGAGPGGGPRVEVFDAVTGQQRFNFFAYDDSLRGGVSVATGDVNGDGVEDVITGAGLGGGAQVKVFDGETGELLASWLAYDPDFRGGVWVAAGDLDGDGIDEVVTGPGLGGGPVVEVWQLVSGSPKLNRSFLAYEEAFRGGVTVACGLQTDGTATIVVGAGPGGGPRVRAFAAPTMTLLADIFAFNPDFTGGVYVASGDVLGAGAGTQILVGPGPGGGPRLRIFALDGTSLADTFAAVDALRNGLTVATLDQVGKPSAILIGAGQGALRGQLADSQLTGLEQTGFFPGFEGGVFVG